MKKAVFALVGALFIEASVAQYDPKALEVLEAMSKKYKSIGAFEANLTSTLPWSMNQQVSKMNSKERSP